MVEELSKLWTDTMSVTVRTAETDESTGRTVFNENVVVQNEPCRVSFKMTFESVSGAKEDAVYASVNQSVKIFLDKNVKIEPGSKIIVSRGDEEFEFVRSGAPAIYDYHQELRVERFKDWA